MLTTAEAQIVFLDTPGIHKPLHKLGEYMVESALSALNEVDAVLWLVEMGNWTKADEHIPTRAAASYAAHILVVNKADLVPAERRAEFMELAAGKRQFAELLLSRH